MRRHHTLCVRRQLHMPMLKFVRGCQVRIIAGAEVRLRIVGIRVDPTEIVRRLFLWSARLRLRVNLLGFRVNPKPSVLCSGLACQR